MNPLHHHQRLSLGLESFGIVVILYYHWVDSRWDPVDRLLFAGEFTLITFNPDPTLGPFSVPPLQRAALCDPLKEFYGGMIDRAKQNNIIIDFTWVVY